MKHGAIRLVYKEPWSIWLHFLRRIVPVAICGTEQATEMKLEHVGRLTAMWAEGWESLGQSEDVELVGRRRTADGCLDETKCVPLFLVHRLLLVHFFSPPSILWPSNDCHLHLGPHHHVAELLLYFSQVLPLYNVTSSLIHHTQLHWLNISI